MHNPLRGDSAPMKLSPSKSQSQEITNVKHILLVLGAAVLFLNTLVIPTAAYADGGSTSTNCGKILCKP